MVILSSLVDWEVPLTVETDGPGRPGEPVACGLPFPRGVLTDHSRLVLEDESRGSVPLQTRVLDRWPDGSVRWIYVRWCAGPDGRSRYRLRPGERADCPAGAAMVVETPGRFRLETSRVTVAMEVGRDLLTVCARSSDEPTRARLEAVVGGNALSARVKTIDVEENGPLYSELRVAAELGSSGRSSPLCVYARIGVYADSPVVRIVLTIRNPRRAQHPGGLWELGDPGSVFLERATLVLHATGGSVGKLLCSPERGAPWTAWPTPFEIHQASSGGENWQSRVHVNRKGEVPLDFRGYRLQAGTGRTEGLRAEPIVALEKQGGRIALVAPHFWQNFPKAIECDGERLALHLFPPRSADGHELQGGEQKTSPVFVALADDPESVSALEWCRHPARVCSQPEWYCSSGAVPHLIPASGDDPAYRTLVDAAIAGPESVVAKRERIDEYGWRNFGDCHADHEEAYYQGPKPVISHYNNQYDLIAGTARRFLKTGDFRWWDLMSELAAHVADIDVYHTDQDRAGYNHGLFWHTAHYTDAGRSSHRSYPRAPGVVGGGPANEHNYTSGLLLHHFLTGDPLSRDTVLDLARWVVDMDDGSKTVLRWLARGPTGLATATAQPSYHGPGRGAANSVNALLDGLQLSGDRAFLSKAEEILRRCIHPQDDVTARGLADVELRWSYVVFLQVLGRYLDLKLELGEIDGMYALGRGSLLAYARWMAEHEYPYLQKPEILEFPTETWAAQDIRKSDVLALASKYAEGAEKERFEERAAFFHRYSVDTLSTMSTHTRTRPIAVLLTSGIVYPALRRTGPEAPRPVGPVGAIPQRPAPFVPQKQVAMRRAGALACAGVLSMVAVALWAVFG